MCLILNLGLTVLKGIYKHANWPVNNRVCGGFEFDLEWVHKIWAGLGSVS